MPNKDELKKFERKRNLTIYAIIVIAFISVSVYMFNNKNHQSDEKFNSSTIDSQENIENKESNLENDVNNYYEDKCKEIVEKFLMSYHKIDSIDRMTEFENTESLLTEECYKDLWETVNAENTLPKNGYVFRSIDKQNIYDYRFDNEKNKVYITAKVYSTWSDENKNVVAKNELTEYHFSFVYVSGNWKIDSLKSKII